MSPFPWLTGILLFPAVVCFSFHSQYQRCCSVCLSLASALRILCMCRQRKHAVDCSCHSFLVHAWRCESVTDKHIRIILPGRGMCRIKWLHNIAPTAAELRAVIEELWPLESLSAILDTFSFQQDACIYLVQGTFRLYSAWIYMDPHLAATDVRLVPCGFHPVSCLPAPIGMHTVILQSHAAWGLFRFAWGPAPPVPRTPHHSPTIIAWETADHDSSDEADFQWPEPTVNIEDAEVIPVLAPHSSSLSSPPDAEFDSSSSSSSSGSSSTSFFQAC